MICERVGLNNWPITRITLQRSEIWQRLLGNLLGRGLQKSVPPKKRKHLLLHFERCAQFYGTLCLEESFLANNKEQSPDIYCCPSIPLIERVPSIICSTCAQLPEQEREREKDTDLGSSKEQTDLSWTLKWNGALHLMRLIA